MRILKCCHWWPLLEDLQYSGGSIFRTFMVHEGAVLVDDIGSSGVGALAAVRHIIHTSFEHKLSQLSVGMNVGAHSKKYICHMKIYLCRSTMNPAATFTKPSHYSSFSTLRTLSRELIYRTESGVCVRERARKQWVKFKRKKQ